MYSVSCTHSPNYSNVYSVVYRAFSGSVTKFCPFFPHIIMKYNGHKKHENMTKPFVYLVHK